MSGKSVGLGVVGAVVGFMLPPGNVAGAVALGAAGFSAGAEMDAADAGVKAAKQNRALANQQANETLQRASENTKAIMREAESFRGQQVSSTVKGGVDVGSTSSLVALESSNANFKRQAFLEERDASLTAQRINAQAQINVDAAKAGRQATQIGAVTSVVGAGASVYANSTKSPKAPSGGGATGNYGTAGGTYTNTGSMA